jgi:predicted NACHT family NTPase
MKEKQIKLFLKKNTAQSEVRELILSEIDKSSSLRKMINIPLMLWMLIKVVEASRRVPITKTIIIEYFMDMLFKREASKDANFNIDENFSMLRSLGLESYNINETNGGLSKVQIENILVKKKKEYGLKISIPSFIEVMVRLNILSLEENLYSFSHQEYQTYLAGEELDIDDFIETS